MKPLSRAAATVTAAALAAGLGLGTAGHAATPAQFATPVQADPVDATQHVVSGATTRPGGQPIDNISVIATDTTSGEPVASALTYGGAFDLHLPAGSYTLTYEDLAGRFDGQVRPDVLVVDGPVVLPPVILYRPSPMADTAPVVVGDRTAGGTLTVTDGIWSAGARRVSVSHSWLLDGQPLSDGASVRILPSHVGHVLTAVVVATASESLPTEFTAEAAIVKADTTTLVTDKTANRTRKGGKVRVTVRVTASTLTPTGKVELVRKGKAKVLKSRRLRDGATTLVVKGMAPGRHKLLVHYRGSALAEPSSTKAIKVKVPRR